MHKYTLIILNTIELECIAKCLYFHPFHFPIESAKSAEMKTFAQQNPMRQIF